jgi:hypothetical protein
MGSTDGTDVIDVCYKELFYYDCGNLNLMLLGLKIKQW